MQLTGTYQVGVRISQTEKSTSFTMILFVMSFNSVFFTVVQATFPLAEQTNKEILANIATRVTGAITKIPVIFLGKVYQFYQFWLDPLTFLLSVFFK